MSDYPDFTEEEKKFRESNGYSVLGWFAWNGKLPKIYKTKSELYPYEVGVEGTSMDVDGDWGWGGKLRDKVDECIEKLNR